MAFPATMVSSRRKERKALSDFYNMKEEVKEIVKTHGGKEFFSELNAARVPFFFTAAVENTAEKTEYLCEAITPNSMGISLTEDKFADFLNIRNHGFVTIPSFDAVSPSVQGLRIFQEAEQEQRQTYYSQDVLAKFNEENMAMIEGGAGLEEELEEGLTEGPADGLDGNGGTISQVAQNVLESVMQHVIMEPRAEDEPEEEETEQIQVPVFHGKSLGLDITWGGGQNPHKDYTGEFAKINERHQGILKGDGSFLQAKEQEAVYYHMGQQPEPGNAGIPGEKEETGKEGDTADAINGGGQ